MADTHITIAVHGRFHAFHLAQALNEVEHPVRLLTTHTMREIEEFGLPTGQAICNPALGFLHRFSYKFQIPQRITLVERLLHTKISKWIAATFRKHPTEVLHSFSGISRDVYSDLKQHRQSGILKLLMRGSAHIKEQYQELSREAQRAGTPIELPSEWIISRETEEYELSDAVITLSEYGRKSFLRQGYPEHRIYSLPLAANVKMFRPDVQTFQQRLDRITSSTRLKVVYAGNISLQKGMIDFVETAKSLSHIMDFTLIGTITPDASKLIQEHSCYFQHIPRVAEKELPSYFYKADIFLMPTVHDGFAVVLAQANASCLPVISTFNSGAPDIITQGKEGWIVPIRSSKEIIGILTRLNQNRQELVDIIIHLWGQRNARTWHDVAYEFLNIVNNTKTTLK